MLDVGCVCCLSLLSSTTVHYIIVRYGIFIKNKNVACVTGVSVCKKNATLKNFFSRLFCVVAKGLINFFYVVFFFWPAYSVTCFNSFDNDDGSNDNIRKSEQSTW
jgi:hypothetical protein